MQVTNLAWAFQSFEAGFERTQTSEEAQALIRWGADYLVSAWNPDNQAFVAVVGDNTTDFNYYGPIEEYQYYNKRPSWYADSANPGELPGLGLTRGSSAPKGLPVCAYLYKDSLHPHIESPISYVYLCCNSNVFFCPLLGPTPSLEVCTMDKL